MNGPLLLCDLRPPVCSLAHSLEPGDLASHVLVVPISVRASAVLIFIKGTPNCFPRYPKDPCALSSED